MPDGVASVREQAVFTTAPASLDHAATRSAGVTRFREGVVATEALPAWWSDPSLPLVYVTFGSVTATIGLFPDLYRAVIARLADLPVRALVTLGEAGDPEALDPVPPNVHVERWWPQSDVIGRAAAMVCHGGFGTVLSGLASGLPMVVMPLFADQWFNAERVEAVGAGLQLVGGLDIVHGLPEALMRVLGDARFREAAGRVRAEIESQVPVEESVAMLEAFGRAS
ncbi:MAG TPA: nucleotide disphospho-sugar-binding domain-containing protein [Actinomycetota bacterium]|nr:nucleotide disphospho-sugar-binding domain-containing protein [Actinomycetota bacterium]